VSGPVWDTRRRAVWPLYVGIVLVAVAVAWMLVRGLPSGDTDDRPPSSAPAPTAETLEPVLVRWGGTGHHLAIVIRNDSDRFVRHARVEITALDAHGRTLMATIGRPRSTCCTVVGLPPGGEYGLYLPLDRPIGMVGGVAVEYASVATEPARSARRPTVEVSRVALHRAADESVVDATFRVRGTIDGFVSGQAILRDRHDRLVGVISGRFYCFHNGTSRRVRMQLFHHVPAGTRVERVLAYPVPAGVPARVPATCPPDQETR
jgi:hypothetical protein